MLGLDALTWCLAMHSKHTIVPSPLSFDKCVRSRLGMKWPFYEVAGRTRASHYPNHLIKMFCAGLGQQPPAAENARRIVGGGAL